MSYTIAIASGKGGTGKTTVAVNLLQTFLDAGMDAALADCDVEEPDDAVFLQPEFLKTEEVTQQLPDIVTSRCVFCGRCAETCAFNAILTVPSAGYIKVMPDLCHSCGVCSYVCPQDGAIIEYPKTMGQISSYALDGREALIEGTLKIGEAMAVPVIQATKKSLHALDTEIRLIDAPPGTSCPAMETIQDADYVVLVAEPTPYGMNDLRIMLQTVREMQLRTGVIINRYGIGDGSLEAYLTQEGVEILTQIPYRETIARIYSKGELLVHALPEMQKLFSALRQKLLKKQKPYATNHHY